MTENIKVGDFVGVHLDGGTCVGELLSFENDLATVAFDNAILEDIPRELCTLFVSVKRQGD